MQKQLTIMAILLVAMVYNHTLGCQFEKHNKDLHEESRKAKPDEPSRHESGRLLQANSRVAMKISLDTTNFNSVIAG